MWILIRHTFQTFIHKSSRPAVWVICSFFLILVGAIDYVTGYRYGFSIFYLIPVMLATYRLGLRAGLVMCVSSTVVWLIADWMARHSYDHPFLPYWNAFIRLAFFLIITFMLARLLEVLEAEKRFARVDPLTGLANLRSFMESVAREIERANRYAGELSLVYVDLDDFKKVNDTLGHLAGNNALKLVASVLSGSIRRPDYAARIGGDEFALLFPETSSGALRVITDRISSRLLEAMGQSSWQVTFSMGAVTCASPGPLTAEEILSAADNLMYRAKAYGKNRTEFGTLEADGARGGALERV